MTEHQAMMELMQRALDDGLDALAQNRLDRHLVACVGCAHEWAGMQALHRQLLAALPATAAGGFTERVLERIAVEQREEQVQRTAAFPLIAAAGVLGALTLALLLSPLIGLTSFDVWAGFLSDSLGLLSAAIAWLSLLMTFVRVGLQTAGDGLLAAALVVGLMVTFTWIRLVAGSDLIRPPAYINGGVS